MSFQEIKPSFSNEEVQESREISSVSVDVEKLKRIVSQLKTLEDQKREMLREIKEVYLSAKSQGYDISALKKIVSLLLASSQNKDKIEQESNMYELYKSALDL